MPRSLVSACLLAAAVPVFAAVAASVHAEEEPKVIQEGSQVAIEYTLKLDDGSTADTNVGEDPLVYQQGSEQILPALEEALEGMAVGETREVTLPPEKGYGVRSPDAYQEVEASVLPEGAAEVGTRLVSQDTEGNRRLVKVHEVKEDKVVLDLNHPLAGETLHFDVKVVGIE
jgi:FKBP-type peptidyl-prolyl cis-trans isomerase 2